MSTLNADSQVADWVNEYPQTARVFEELEIDYCCGGNTTLTAACGAKQLDPQVVLCQLAQVVADPQHEASENWLDATLTDLCRHIEQTHHDYLRRELPRLSDAVEKVTSVHATAHPELHELRRVFAVLRAELEPHMLKEERVLFPAIRELEDAEQRPAFAFLTVSNPIRAMRHEHDAAGYALAQLRELTAGFTPPADACNTYRMLLGALQALEQDMHQHVHKENNILFPRAQQLEAVL